MELVGAEGETTKCEYVVRCFDVLTGDVYDNDDEDEDEDEDEDDDDDDGIRKKGRGRTGNEKVMYMKRRLLVVTTTTMMMTRQVYLGSSNNSPPPPPRALKFFQIPEVRAGRGIRLLNPLQEMLIHAQTSYLPTNEGDQILLMMTMILLFVCPCCCCLIIIIIIMIMMMMEMMIMMMELKMMMATKRRGRGKMSYLSTCPRLSHSPLPSCFCSISAGCGE
eukprot:749879-Hanusia_phi.AAC.3